MSQLTRSLAIAFLALICSPVRGEEWTKHVVHRGVPTATAVGADFTGDGKIDVIAASGGKVRLIVAPDWKEIILFDSEGMDAFIHSEVMDVDGDGDPDYLAASNRRDKMGGVYWFENPKDATRQRWVRRHVDRKLRGLHCLLRADVDRDGRDDLLANSFDTQGDFPNSLTWQKIPAKPREADSWIRNVFGRGDAPGGNHYFGFGDLNNDGRGDVTVGAKGGPGFPGGQWFAWWEQPADPTQAWTKHMIAADQPGATNIHPADVNGDQHMDLIASRGHGKGVLWFEGPDWTIHEIDPELAGPHCLVVADIDGDGDTDAATCAKDDKLAVWYESNGKGAFKRHVIGKDQAAYDIRALDMDADGDLDLLIAGQASKNVVWYANPKKR